MTSNREYRLTEIGELPIDWTIKPLPKLLSFIVDNRGKTVPTSENGIPLIATNCIKENALYPVKERLRYLSQETYETWFRSHPIPNDILFVNKGTPGQVCLVPEPVDFCIAQDMVALRANPNEIYWKFLFAYLRSGFFKKQVEGLNVGTTIPHLKKSVFNQLLIPIPSEREQISIGDLYFELSNKIELNLQMNQTLEAIAQAVFKEWFVNFNFSGFDGELVDGLPKGWKMGKLGDFFDFVKGVSYRSAELMESKMALVTLKSMNRLGGLNYNGFKEFNGKYKESQELKVGDVVIAQTDITQAADVIGCPAIVENPFNYEKLIASIDLVKCVQKTERFSSLTLFYFLSQKSFKNYCLSHTNGSTVLHLRSSEIPKYEFIVPDANTLIEFDKIISSIRDKIIINNNQNQMLANTRDSLLPKLMTGKIEIQA